jgi:hypothetical protein
MAGVLAVVFFSNFSQEEEDIIDMGKISSLIFGEPCHFDPREPS